MANVSNPPLISGLSDLVGRYDSLICDVWGVVHNGSVAYPQAVDALARFRDRGGRVALVTNAPRPFAVVQAMLDGMGVARGAYDAIVTSGDTARAVLAQRPGVRIFHVGPERDLPIYDGLDVRLVDEIDCELVSCTGLFDDENETPDDYADSLQRWESRGLPMLCINPDIVVERGDRLIWCAGALAERYRERGGETIIVGKPYAPIYEEALRTLRRLHGGRLDQARVLAVGDGIDTDVRGAIGQGIDVLFITGGIHAAVFGSRTHPDIAAVQAFLLTAGLGAVALANQLVWDGAVIAAGAAA